jgi:5-(carboxyamino)imidazole ribonucleotide mutase
VLSVGTGSGGAANAALSAARILALSDAALARTLDDYRKSLADSVEEKDARIKAQFKRQS